MKKTIRKAAFIAAAGYLALTSCSTTSVMGLSKASYVDGELEKLNARTEEVDRLEARLDELSVLEDKVDALNGAVGEAKAADEELRGLAAEFAEKLDELSRDTLMELVEAIMEHLEEAPVAD